MIKWTQTKQALIKGVHPSRLLKLDGPDLSPFSRAVCTCLVNGIDPRRAIIYLAQEPQGCWKWQRKYHYSLQFPAKSGKFGSFYTVTTGGYFIQNHNGNWRKGYELTEKPADWVQKLASLDEIPIIKFLFSEVA
jgi:hypothetical protein